MWQRIDRSRSCHSWPLDTFDMTGLFHINVDNTDAGIDLTIHSISVRLQTRYHASYSRLPGTTDRTDQGAGRVNFAGPSAVDSHGWKYGPSK